MRLSQRLFFTLTLADFHCPHLHRFLSIPEGSSTEDIKKILKDNPHRVNWYFVKKFEIFKSVYLEGVLKCLLEFGGWVWYRFEWQHRDAILVHGLCRMGEAPDLTRLSEMAINGHKIHLEITKDVARVASVDEAEQIRLGLELIELHDKNVCTDMRAPYSEYITPNQGDRILPMKKTASSDEVKEVDMDDLVVCLQRHNCKAGRCFKQRDNQYGCRWKYPKPAAPTTTIKYSQG